MEGRVGVLAQIRGSTSRIDPRNYEHRVSPLLDGLVVLVGGGGGISLRLAKK